MVKRAGTDILRKKLIANGCWIECACCTFGAEKDNWTGLEIAHIIPHSVGGSDDVDNLVILCKACHLEAPNTTSVEFFHAWLNERNKSLEGPGAVLWKLCAEFLTNPPPEAKAIEDWYYSLPREEGRAKLATAVRKANERLQPTRHWGALGDWNYATTKAMALETLRNLA